ncbi:MAG: glycosyltransferase [Opitutus sp.]|nr:glycosyltransferase [Opitutus sp.]
MTTPAASSRPAPAASPPPAPRTVLLLKPDTLGDLVLLAPTLNALRAAWPQTRIAVLIRRAYLDLAPLLAPSRLAVSLVEPGSPNRPGIEWIATTLDPFSQGPDADPTELARLRAAVAELAPDVIAAVSSRRNWLEIALAAAPPTPTSSNGPAARRLALGTTESDEIFSTQLRVMLGLSAAAAFTETIPTAPDEPDWRRNFALADTLLGRSVERTAPSLVLDAAAKKSADDLLRSLGLARGGYAACAAAGFANVKLKTWPADRFGAAVKFLHDRHGLRTLLVGHESERQHLEEVRAHAGSATPALWLGGEGSLPALASLIAGAKLYLGNDTGAMHLAAALDVPLVAVFGGGTWPRFTPAARRAVALVQPLPCFGCGWDCAFGDAPCIGGLTVADVTAALDFACTNHGKDFSAIRRVEPLPAATRELMGAAAARYRALRTEHLARQHKLEELTALDREKDEAILDKESALALNERSLREKEAAIAQKEAEIIALKAVCDERERVIFILDGQVRSQRAELNAPAAALAARDAEIAALRATIIQRDAALQAHPNTLAPLEQARHYLGQLQEKERMLQILHRVCAEREALIRRLAAESTEPTAHLRRLGLAAAGWWHARVATPFRRWLERKILDGYWMQIGILQHYPPRPLRWDHRVPRATLPADQLPRIGIVTPSYNQAAFLGSTMTSVFGQNYPHLRYVVQDGGSTDGSEKIIRAAADRLYHWESARDRGQADAIRQGFARLSGALGPDDLMAWLNSDDLLGTRTLHCVAQYFVRHPDVDVVYGHRIIIDDSDRDIGRWVMPPHENAALEWIDYVPQETLFWRKRAWDRVGGLDPSFQFALDWDLIVRFQQAGLRLVRLPYFLGAFRVHAAQKTSQQIHTLGHEEMTRIRAALHGGAINIDHQKIERYAHQTRVGGALAARLMALGIRW